MLNKRICIHTFVFASAFLGMGALPLYVGAQTPAKKTVAKPAAAKTSTAKPAGNAQTDRIKKLQNEQSQVKQNVKQIDSKLSENHKTVQQKLSQIEQLNEDIRLRNALIDSQNTEITYLTERIAQMNDEILGMEMDYNVAKRKYVELIYQAYQKNSVYDRLLFLFSANSIQQSYTRFQYIREFAKMRRRQASDIKDTRIELLEKRRNLELTKRKSENLLASREMEKKKVETEKLQQKELVASLKKEEKQLREQLKAKQQAADKLNRRIQDLIAAEAAKAVKTAQQKKTTAKNTPVAVQKTVAPAKTATPAKNNAAKQQQQPAKPAIPTETAKDPVSLNFEKQKGRMHWPVRVGKLTGHFGLQKHPAMPNETVVNKGVFITSPAGIDALAVSEGRVTEIVSEKGVNNAVIVRHGVYLTVYANLTSIFVQKGQSVKQGDKLGRLYTDPYNTANSQLYFQIWKERNIQNPELWLRPLK